MLAASGPPAFTGIPIGMTASVLGAMPKLHIIIAPITTCCGILQPPLLNVLTHCNRKARLRPGDKTDGRGEAYYTTTREGPGNVSQAPGVNKSIEASH